MKRIYIKPEVEVTEYVCDPVMDTMSETNAKTSSGTWDLNSKERDAAEDYQESNSSSDWSEGLW